MFCLQRAWGVMWRGDAVQGFGCSDCTWLCGSGSMGSIRGSRNSNVMRPTACYVFCECTLRYPRGEGGGCYLLLRVARPLQVFAAHTEYTGVYPVCLRLFYPVRAGSLCSGGSPTDGADVLPHSPLPLVLWACWLQLSVGSSVLGQYLSARHALPSRSL